ncbi:FAD-dependent monooxygenase sdcF [Fulvia fulva]|uniref:FAD-dependent monooxygenase sdcF n=1 Tax=Passalora fulva TaxID=5499 RepID=A0A9Q8LHA1_PASFU|nr:FAD-dependent monooxygenase sdcF [Fulvia fulva]KAK4624653.1 FAD-dependent monooxygenase sdcF [Fulvia fulva]KAK4625005.1 FAD-dependent monooxygenase sdcF [Fulvia fulva]UJO17411.1 FAD-dependent monooxygenase sdcF [Fulvia fulva]WPV14610.1 FAD-dependent monooxygenase sdcF [Fulvia fulva]WPV30070.1 FAD-dependent monooxygenase sdcF [Fulvia fulva]
MLALLDIFDEAMTYLFHQIPHFSGLMAFQPLHPIMTSRSAATGGNVLGIGPEDGYVVNADPNMQWAGAENDVLVKEVWEKAFAERQRLAEEHGVATDWLYLNYAEKWQDPIKGYGKDNVEFMRKVSRKYDPKGVFQRQLSGGFKLWNHGGSS